MSTKVLLADLSNGDCFKLALAEPGGRPEKAGLYGCGSLTDFEDAVLTFLADNGQPQLSSAAFSTSGWEVDGQIDLVHYGFTLNRHHISKLLGVQRLTVVNDFVAKALAVPVLEANERIQVCGDYVRPRDVVAVVGPTAGLGGAFLSPDGRGGWVATHCEGGHSDFAPCTELEIDILKLMMARYGHVSRERAVSAPGLSELWRCLSVLDGDDDAELSPEEIMAMAYIDEPRARKAIQVQTELFAGVASDFALTMGAKGGVYLSGCHLDALGDLFDHDVFARRFYAKGRVTSYVRDIPVYKIAAVEPELLGLSTLFE